MDANARRENELKKVIQTERLYYPKPKCETGRTLPGKWVNKAYETASKHKIGAAERETQLPLDVQPEE